MIPLPATGNSRESEAVALNGRIARQAPSALSCCWRQARQRRTAPVIASGILYIGTKSGGVEAFAAR
ncbi:hypothetical protein EAS64_42075 [Trebonia kvetii]|uniref:Uncharacterized protein n=1 Tax=Trebonia kvetii TaxID=2480626 RepID=A0A6P2BKF4_9ACTN|nr:hypothetical protein [Trebonia kvetii]TVY99033.1 hypothetical protein EAS64_42075 [Trebonia kvetii]